MSWNIHALVSCITLDKRSSFDLYCQAFPLKTQTHPHTRRKHTLFFYFQSPEDLYYIKSEIKKENE